MQPLLLKGTEQTPDVTFNKESGKFEISGRSITDAAQAFYQPLHDWMAAYAKSPNPSTEISFKLEYINTSTSKAILDLLAVLQLIQGAKVVWYFQDEDEDMEEAGEEFSELVKIPFELKAY